MKTLKQIHCSGNHFEVSRTVTLIASLLYPAKNVVKCRSDLSMEKKQRLRSNVP